MSDKKVKKTAVDAKELAEFCIKCAEEKQAENAVLLHVGAASSIADYYVIATASSEPQLRAMAGEIERGVREKYQKHTRGTDGIGESGWILLDFGNVLIHLMTPEMRARYNLEGLWGEATIPEKMSQLEQAAEAARK